MYHNKNNNFFHGIMFHHFHDNNFHKKNQGSISKDDFYKIIKFIGRNRIIDADKFHEKLLENKLNDKDVCFTFDDCLKNQFDVALPVLEDFKIKSFFFVYSSIFDKKPDNLEVFRYFRTNFFETIDFFYETFFSYLGDHDNLSIFLKKNKNILKEKKKKFPFYSDLDLKFRLVRDKYLDKYEYEKIMFKIMKDKKFFPEKIYSKLFFQEKDLIQIDNLGHTIGLHSHTHPIRIENLTYQDQKNEYKKNIEILSKVLNKRKNSIKSMSHPCGSYNLDTLKILKEINIEIGFKQIMSIEPERGMTKINNSNYEIAREDHSKIMNMINK